LGRRRLHWPGIAASKAVALPVIVTARRSAVLKPSPRAVPSASRHRHPRAASVCYVLRTATALQTTYPEYHAHAIVARRDRIAFLWRHMP